MRKNKNLNYSKENLDLASTTMPTLSLSPIGRVGAYTYYTLAEELAKKRFNNQIISSVAIGIVMASVFIFSDIVSSMWIEAWLILGIFEVSIVTYLALGHKKYIQIFEPARLKYLQLEEIDDNTLQNIIMQSKYQLPAESFQDKRVSFILRKELNLDNEEVDLVNSLCNEYEGDVKELIDVVKNLKN